MEFSMPEYVYPWGVQMILTLVISYFVFKAVTYGYGIIGMRLVIRKKQKERAAQFRELESRFQFQSDEHDRILTLSNEDLLDLLQRRKVTATKVLEAFIAKALRVTSQINAVTEFVPQAEEWAKELDAMKEPKGPLHGLPISVKDNCNIEGMDSTIGLGKFLYQPAKESAVIIKVLMDLGAIPFVKTNVPQTLLSFGCANPVFGLTKNALNLNLSPGGSSGGESSLIAAAGSRLGVGSDIGGSVRIPAHFTGVVGFKVTKNRFSGAGFRGSLPNVVGLYGVPGLLTNDVGLLVVTCKHLLKDNKFHKYDPLAVPVPWNELMFSEKRKLRIGYFTSLSYWPPVGDTQDVMGKAKMALERQGHTLVPYKMPDSFAMMNLVFDFAFADKGELLLRNWKDEPIPLSVIVNFLICKAPLWLRRIITLIMRCPLVPFIYSRRAISIIGRGANKTGDLWTRLGDRKEMTEKLIESWQKKNLDLLLTPTYPFPAVPHHLPGRLQPSVVYTMIWNLFDFPCGVVRFGTESAQHVDQYDTQWDMVLRTAKNAVKQATGMPISVQIVGLPFQEEMVLRGMQELEAVSPVHVLS